jgi:hypothetical protein
VKWTTDILVCLYGRLCLYLCLSLCALLALLLIKLFFQVEQVTGVQQHYCFLDMDDPAHRCIYITSRAWSRCGSSSALLWLLEHTAIGNLESCGKRWDLRCVRMCSFVGKTSTAISIVERVALPERAIVS